jgi:hypothetical protein
MHFVNHTMHRKKLDLLISLDLPIVIQLENITARKGQYTNRYGRFYNFELNQKAGVDPGGSGGAPPYMYLQKIFVLTVKACPPLPLSPDPGFAPGN